MQVKQLKREGLDYELEVTVKADDIITVLIPALQSLQKRQGWTVSAPARYRPPF